MMIKKLPIALCAVLLMGCCCVGSNKASRQPAAPTCERVAATPLNSGSVTTVRCGGYTEQRKLTAPERVLFKKAMQEMDGVSYKPVSVATQVVAGLNYRFVCEATTVTRKGQRYAAEVLLFQPLPGQGEVCITAINKL